MDENGYIKIIGRIKVRQWIDFLFLHFTVATVCLCMCVHVCAVCVVCLGGGGEVGGEESADAPCEEYMTRSV